MGNKTNKQNCPEMRQPGGCQLNNLQCRAPECFKAPNATPNATAGAVVDPLVDELRGIAAQLHDRAVAGKMAAWDNESFSHEAIQHHWARQIVAAADRLAALAAPAARQAVETPLSIGAWAVPGLNGGVVIDERAGALAIYGSEWEARAAKLGASFVRVDVVPSRVVDQPSPAPAATPVVAVDGQRSDAYAAWDVLPDALRRALELFGAEAYDAGAADALAGTDVPAPAVPDDADFAVAFGPRGRALLVLLGSLSAADRQRAAALGAGVEHITAGHVAAFVEAYERVSGQRPLNWPAIRAGLRAALTPAADGARGRDV